MLTRRETLALGLTAAAGSLVWTRAAAQTPPAQSSARAADPRRPLNADWRFLREDAADARNPDFDDSTWQTVTLPHTWNAQDGQDGGNNYHRGPAWYRLKLPDLAALRGRVLYLHVGAASLRAEAFLNGKRLGDHRGGFAAFAVDLTPAVDWDGPNVLAIRVDNTHHDDTPPWSADFTFFGGLYRGVELLALPPLHVARLVHAAPAIRATTRSLDAKAAVIDVVAKLRNMGPDAQATVIVEALDAAGKPVAQAETTVTAGSGAEVPATLSVQIPSPHRWHGRRDPYCYTLRLSVRGTGLRPVSTGDNDATAGDKITLPLGLREFRVDVERGFFLNGEPYRLHGVNRHQDRIDKGWAIGKAEHDEDLKLIADMGCTTVRLAHYPHDPYAYELCDRLGLVVWAEIPLIDRIDGSDAFTQNARQQLTEMIEQHRHHPSICFWGVHNEITAPWKKDSPDPAPLIAELAKLSRQLDPTRPSVCAATDPVDHPANWTTDLTAFNRYWGWYHDEPAGFAGWVDATHAKYPQKALGISEYGAGASIHHHEDPPAKPVHNGEWHPEEYQAELHEQHWAAMRARPWLWGTFVWNMFDFASDGRKEGDLPGRNDKGLVSYDRRTPKDAYYFYQSQWSDQPMVHLAMQRFDPRKTSPIRVKAYSNCPHVELVVNDRSLGTLPGDHGIFLWNEVQLAPGVNNVRVVATGRGAPLESRAAWRLQA